MSLTRVRRIFGSTLLALGALPLFAAQGLAQTGSIAGRITDAGTGAPIEAAQIQAQMSGGQSLGATSGADGTYRINAVPAGMYTVTVRRVGYEQRQFMRVEVSNGATATVNASMTSIAAMLTATVVTSTRNQPEKALDAPAQISVITSERIAERPAVTVTDHLRGTVGVDINKGGIAQANIVARGFNNAFSGSMLMLQDYRFAGVPSLRVNVPFMFTGTNEDIERMEVLLGPASALYGPNSASGVLHVITKSPFASVGTTVSVDGGERSTIRTGLRHAGVLSDRLGYKVSGEFMRANDWEYNDRAEPTTFPTSSNIPEARRGQPNTRDFNLQRVTGEARIDFRPTENSEAITTLGHTRIGSGLEYTGANGTAQIKDWTYTNLQQRYRNGRFFAQAFINMSDAGNDTSSSAQGTYLLRSGQPIVDQSRVWALQAQHGLDLGTRQSFTYGVDYIHTDPRTGGTINGANENDDNVTEYGAYLQSNTRLTNKFEILAAGRFDANNVIEGNFFSPRAALIFKPTETQNVRLTYNRAFSTPANFSFFLDLIQAPNVGGSGYDIVARGNPPKEGYQFRRDCNSAAFGQFCMRSRFVQGGEYTGANAAAAFPGLIAGLGPQLTPGFTGGIQQGLQAAGFTAAEAAALAPNLATGLVTYLAGRTPGATDLTTRVSYINAATVPLTPERVTDLKPLEASFNQTYELGYKGIVGNRFRYDISYWGQERGDVATTGAIATPNVFFGDPTQLGTYLGGNMGAYLVPALMQQAGLSQAQATQLAGQLAPALASAVTPTLASVPLGVVTFANRQTSPNQIYASYQRLDRKIWIRGLDVATDVMATDRLTFDIAYSWQSQNVWNDIIVGGIPFMANAPNSRGSLGARYRNETNGWGFESRVRYSESYPVNSGVYATNTAFAIAAGQPGAPTGSLASTATGYGRCSPAAAGTFCYENVPEAFIFDAQVSKRFDLGTQRLTWSLNAQNLFDNRIRTFPGFPEIGRMVMTRLQYTF